MAWPSIVSHLVLIISVLNWLLVFSTLATCHQIDGDGKTQIEVPIIQEPDSQSEPESIQEPSNSTNETINHPMGTLSDDQLETKIHEFQLWLSMALNATDKKNTDDPSADDQNVPEAPIDLGSFSQFFELGRTITARKATCDAATVFVGYLFLRIRQSASEKEIENTCIFICRLAVTSRATTSDVCDGLMERMGPTFYFIVKEKPDLTPKAFVGTVLQQVGCDTDDPTLEWSVDLSQKKKRKPRNKDRQNGISPKNTTISTIDCGTSECVKIIHFADLHIDPLYEPGAKADCSNNILCCHPADGRPANETDGAGYFGDDRKCDTPWETLDMTLRHMAEEHPDTRFMYMTGDLVPHNIWYTSKRDNSYIVRKASAMIKQHFPNTLVVPMLGNHEPHPVNFPRGVPADLATDWIYSVSYESWKDWIPADQKENFLKAGFYSIDVDPTLRIVALNTNVCYGFNFWQMYENRDPGGQLTWLVDELYKAESRGQNVHIVGHVPPGHPDCSKVWSRNFYNIITRFKSTVKGQWYGHTHYDELKLFYHPENRGEPINALWIGGSLTPYRVHNMAYKIFTADGARGSESTWDIHNHETWIFDLRKSNLDPDVPPTWYRLYSAKDAYGIPNTLPKSLGSFVDKLAMEKDTFDLFYQHYFKASSPENREECDVFCRKLILCGIVQPYHGDDTECQSVQKKVDGVPLPGADPAMPPIRNNNTFLRIK